MSTRAALSFDRSKRTPGDLKKFWDADPLGAARWMANVGKAAQTPVAPLEKVAKILAGRGTDEFKEQKLRELGARQPKLFDVMTTLATTQVARAQTMGWSAEPQPWREAPSFTGTLKLNAEGNVQLRTTRGTFDLTYAPTADDWRDEIETAFLNQTVTLKGFPSEDGKTLELEQFGPGASDAFVSGRIKVEGDRVFVSPNTSGAMRAEITDPTFKKLLMGDASRNLVDYGPAGVILPGKVEVKKDGKAVYAHHPPEGFYLLGRVMKHTTKKLPGGKEHHLMETGYFHHSDAISPTGLKIPASAKPNAKVGPAGDYTDGDTQLDEGRRTFFWVQILHPDTAVEGVELTHERRFEVTWVGQAGDRGSHVDSWNLTPASNLEHVAQALPAATPAIKPGHESFEPATRKKFEGR